MKIKSRKKSKSKRKSKRRTALERQSDP